MSNVIYIKKVDNYDDILKEKYYRIPLIFKKLVFMYKNMFNKITKKNIDGENIWILPIQDKIIYNKLRKLMKEIYKYKEYTYVISEELENVQVYKLMKEYDISYLNGNNIKKYLILKVLEYITNLQNQEIGNIGISILVKDISEFNIYLVEKLSKVLKNIKVVTPNIYKFKKLEEKLYIEYGIAIQFSNSYKKSLSKSNIIVNLDFNQIDINEYEIFNKAIIINTSEEIIKIKSKLFNGIVINSYNVKFKREIRDKFRKLNIYHKYDSLLLYESYINKEKNLDKIFNSISEDKVSISSLIGINGVINKKEFKNIFKKLDK